MARLSVPGYFDFSGLSFPKLETLGLGYYTLAHNDDLDWILSITSLRKLILHNCMILSWIRIMSDSFGEWEVRTHDWERLESERDWDEIFSYNGKWSHYFDRIAQALPNLADFRFDRGRPSCVYDLAHSNDTGVQIFPQRYICFDHGILPTHWPEADNDGKMDSWMDPGFPINLHKEHLEADQKSLDSLINKVNSRR